MPDLFDNPMGLMGFEFVEFASPTPGVLEPLFEKMGFTLVARHRSKDVLLYRQGDINFIVNREPRSLAGYFAAEHGPSACALAFRVKRLAQGLRAGAGARRAAGGRAHRADGAAAAGHQGHRRRAAVPDRPLRRRQEHLRHRLRMAAGHAAASARATA
jgi:4-hydroxyphenylpyruvate dioxygenase-like putative hemolysin